MKKRSVKAWLSLTSVSGQHNKSKAIRYTAGYGCRRKELLAIVYQDKFIVDKDNIDQYKEWTMNKWHKIMQYEKRVDARLQYRLVLPIPNGLGKNEIVDLVGGVTKKLTDKGTYKLHVDACLHRGKKNGGLNRHIHVIFSERDLQTMKKVRHIKHRSFILDLYQVIAKKLEEFGYNVEKTPDILKEPRVPHGIYMKYLRDPEGTMKKYGGKLIELHQIRTFKKNQKELDDLEKKSVGHTFVEAIGCNNIQMAEYYRDAIMLEYEKFYRTMEKKELETPGKAKEILNDAIKRQDFDMFGFYLQEIGSMIENVIQENDLIHSRSLKIS